MFNLNNYLVGYTSDLVVWITVVAGAVLGLCHEKLCSPPWPWTTEDDNMLYHDNDSAVSRMQHILFLFSGKK